MKSIKATTRGSILISSAMRKKYKIKAGTIISLVEESDGIKLIPFTYDLVKAKFGILGTKGKLLKALKKEKKIECEQ